MPAMVLILERPAISDMVVMLVIADHEVRTSHKAIVPKEKLCLVYNAKVLKWERHPKVPFLLLGFPEPRMVTPRGALHPCQRYRWHL
jgi:hypothetical protein